MRCAYTAGALVALARECGVTTPNSVFALSGSAGNALYFVAGQYDAIERIWTELLSTRRFVSFARLWRVMDIDYLVDKVFTKQEPLNIPRLRSSMIRYCIPVTDALTHVPRYFSNGEADALEVLRAAKALPFLYGKRVTIDGGAYVDGGLSVTFDDLLTRAKDSGAKRIIAIDASGERRPTPDDERVIFVRRQRLPARLLTTDSRRLGETFTLGYKDMVRCLPDTDRRRFV